MEQETMPNWLEKRAFLTPDRVAFIAENESLTFRELNNRVQDRAKQLLGLGVKPQDKVGLLSGNTLAMVVLYHALTLVRAVAVPLNIRLSESELGFQLEDCEASFLFYENEVFNEKAEAIISRLPFIKVMPINELVHEKSVNAPLFKEVVMDEPHTIIYTSGTTGFPKGVVLTYKNHWWSAVGSALNLGLDTSDKWLACVPLFHVSGLSILMKNVIYGMTVQLYRNFDPGVVNQAIIHEKVTMISVVSTMLQNMLHDLDGRLYPESFRCMLLGGGPAPSVILEACRDKHIPIYQTYGLTESSSQIVTLAPEYMLKKLGSAGKPLFPSQIKIMADDRAASPNEPGEIIIKGPNVTAQYFKRSQATAETIKDGWLSTGDIGYLDEEGFLYVLDRRKDLIISGGENVYPAEIESVLLHHPSVEEAGVIGIDDSRWGQVPAAFIKLSHNNEDVKEADIIAFTENRLAAYKMPKKVYFVENLPRNASNKLLRRELSKLLENKL